MTKFDQDLQLATSNLEARHGKAYVRDLMGWDAVVREALDGTPFTEDERQRALSEAPDLVDRYHFQYGIDNAFPGEPERYETLTDRQLAKLLYDCWTAAYHEHF